MTIQQISSIQIQNNLPKMGCSQSHQLSSQNPTKIATNDQQNVANLEKSQSIVTNSNIKSNMSSSKRQVKLLKNFVYEVKSDKTGFQMFQNHDQIINFSSVEEINIENVIFTLQPTNQTQNDVKIDNFIANTNSFTQIQDITLKNNSKTLGQITLKNIYALCQSCFSKLERYSKKHNKWRQCPYCKGYGLKLKRFSKQFKPKCQRENCTKQGCTSVGHLLLCTCCNGSGKV